MYNPTNISTVRTTVTITVVHNNFKRSKFSSLSAVNSTEKNLEYVGEDCFGYYSYFFALILFIRSTVPKILMNVIYTNI